MKKPAENLMNSVKKLLETPGYQISTFEIQEYQDLAKIMFQIGDKSTPQNRQWRMTQFGGNLRNKAGRVLSPSVEGAVIKDDLGRTVVKAFAKTVEIEGKEQAEYFFLNSLPVIKQGPVQVSARLFHELAKGFENTLQERMATGSSRDRSDLIRQMVVFALNNPDFANHTQRDIV